MSCTDECTLKSVLKEERQTDNSRYIKSSKGKTQQLMAWIIGERKYRGHRYNRVVILCWKGHCGIFEDRIFPVLLITLGSIHCLEAGCQGRPYTFSDFRLKKLHFRCRKRVAKRQNKYLLPILYPFPHTRKTHLGHLKIISNKREFEGKVKSHRQVLGSVPEKRSCHHPHMEKGQPWHRRIQWAQHSLMGSPCSLMGNKKSPLFCGWMFPKLADCPFGWDKETIKCPDIYSSGQIHIPEWRPLPRDRLRRCGAVVDHIYPETTRETLRQLKLSWMSDINFFHCQM